MDKSIHNLLKEGDLSRITTYQAGVMQASTHRLLQKKCDDILRSYGISKMQWLIIGTVFDAGTSGVRLTDLAEQLDTTQSYLTTTINLLVSKTMLIRTDNIADSRSKFVSIDPDFAPICNNIEQTLRQALRRSIYAHIDPAEFRIYMKVLYQLSKFNDKNKNN